MTDAMDFLVQRTDLRQSQIAPARLEPQSGEVLLRIEKFGLTANNITYAVFGDAMQYWNFFPASDGWGRVPVWGFATVAESKHEAIRAGERVYGYLPMSTHVIVQPDRVTAESFMDGVAHRRPLPSAYQLYGRCAHDPLHDPQHEDERALLHPLFFTSFLIEDFISDNQLFGARQVVLASASSKTALGVAFLLSSIDRAHGALLQGIDRAHGALLPEKGDRLKSVPLSVIGLTSPGNKAFCEKLGHYDQVVTYDALASLPADVPTVFVDMAGEGKLLHAIHHHFGENLKYSCIVGATHWENRATQHNLPGAKPQFFFAPTQGQKRRKDWGPGGVETRFASAWRTFLPSVKNWLQVRVSKGPEAVQSVYLEVLEGRVPPQVGNMLSL